MNPTTHEREDDVEQHSVPIKQKRRCKYCSAKTVLKVIFALIFFGGAGGALYYLGKAGYMEKFFKYVKMLGPWGNVLLAAAFIPSGFPFVFVWIALCTACGFLYGIWYGLATAAGGSTLSMLIVFPILRTCFHAQLLAYIQKNKKLSIMSELLERHPLKFTILTRFLPITFGVQNAILAVSNIFFLPCFITSVLTLAPVELALTFVGSRVKSLSDISCGKLKFTPAEYAILGVEVFVTIAVVVGVVIYARWVWKKAALEDGLPDPDGDEVHDSQVYSSVNDTSINGTSTVPQRERTTNWLKKSSSYKTFAQTT